MICSARSRARGEEEEAGVECDGGEGVNMMMSEHDARMMRDAMRDACMMRDYV